MYVSEPLIIAIIALIGTLVTSGCSVYLSIRNGRKINSVNDKVSAVHADVNGRLSQLLEVNKKASRAEGVIEGTASELARDKTV